MENIIKTKNYTEVYSILNSLNLLNNLPIDVKEFIEKNIDEEYNLKINTDIPLIEQIEDTNTLNLISYLYLKYLNTSQYEKELLINKYNENEELYNK